MQMRRKLNIICTMSRLNLGLHLKITVDVSMHGARMHFLYPPGCSTPSEISITGQFESSSHKNGLLICVLKIIHLLICIFEFGVVSQKFAVKDNLFLFFWTPTNVRNLSFKLKKKNTLTFHIWVVGRCDSDTFNTELTFCLHKPERRSLMIKIC